MPDAARALLIVNRRASRSASALEDGVAILKDAGIDVVVEEVEDPERMPACIRDDTRADMILVGGGDGSISAAVDAVVETQRPLGVLPMGNANDLARTLGIPVDLLAACRIIAGGHRRRIDLGRANDKLFLNAASLGIGPQIARDMTGDLKRRWGPLGYVIAAWTALKRSRPFKVRVTSEAGTQTIRSMHVTVGNGRHYGGGMTVVDDAAIDDERLDLYSVKPIPLWKLILLLPLLRWGKHRGVEDVHLMAGRWFLLETKRRLPVNVDGEVLAHTPVRFELVPKALDVFVAAGDTQTR